MAIRNSKLKNEWTIFNMDHQYMTFADDLTIMARTKKELMKFAERIEEEARKFGLEIIQNKTKYMVMGQTQDPGNLTPITNINK